MKAPRKALVSFFLTLIIAAVVIAAGRETLFTPGRLRFYNPFLTRTYQAALDADARVVQAFFAVQGAETEAEAPEILRNDETGRVLGEHLGRMGRGEAAILLAEPAGVILGLPPADAAGPTGAALSALLFQVAAFWNSVPEKQRIAAGRRANPAYAAGTAGIPGKALNFLRGLVSKASLAYKAGPAPVFEYGGASRILFSARTSQNILVGRLEPETTFELPPLIEYLLFPVFFISLWLSLFLLFSLRRDPPALVRRRTALFHRSLLHILPSGAASPRDILGSLPSRSRLEQRREDLRREFQRGLTTGRRPAREKEINRLLDCAWDELLTITRSPGENGNAPDPQQAEAPEEVGFFEAADEETPTPYVPVKRIIKEANMGDQNKEEGIAEQNPETVEELEELEELEDFEELEELAEEGESGAAVESVSTAPARPDFGALASEIEFAPVSEIDEDELLMGEDLEIVDPFADMLSDLSEAGANGDLPASKKKTNRPRELTASFPDATQPITLNHDSRISPAAGSFFAVYPNGRMIKMNEKVILEQNGLHRVNTRYFTPDQETLDSLDGEFKKLIDSVLRR
jgi:hypothetical protein